MSDKKCGHMIPVQMSPNVVYESFLVEQSAGCVWCERDSLSTRLAQAERERDAAEQRAEKAEKESAQASTTIKSLCDRIDRICSIAHDRNMHPSARLEQIHEWSEGFMPIPDAALASTPRDEVETTAAGSTGEESRRDYQTPVLANNPAGSFARTKTYGGKP